MNKLVSLLILIVLFSGCSTIKNSIKYNDVCQAAIHQILNEEYGKAIESFGTKDADSIQLSKAKATFIGFRDHIIKNFGKDVTLKFITSTKRFSTENNAENLTSLVIQIRNQTHYGYFDITMDDSVGKIKNIYLRNFKEEIPNTFPFWLLGILPLAVLILNVYTIIKIRRSNFSKKWLLILFCILLNWPTLNIYIDRISLEFSFQILLGIGFQLMGYDNYVWSVGIPIGALISLYAIRPMRASKEQLESGQFPS
jgi:hypothetical protein